MIGPLPVFRTSRLIVRPRTMADLEACLAMDGEPTVTRYVAAMAEGIRAPPECDAPA